MSNPPSADSPALSSAEFARYRTGDLLIEIGRQRVTRGEDPIALPKLSFDLLLALMRGAPNLLSSDALMKEVWPRVIVSPETLNQRVKLLRDALGDDPRRPRYIEGLRGRGYRWVPAVETQSTSLTASHAGVAASSAGPVPGGASDALQVPQVRSAQRTSRPARASRKLWLAALVIAAIAAAAILVSLLREPSTGPPTSVRVAAVQPRAVAVLPFEDLSQRQSDSYIARGVAGAVLHKLAGVPELIVVSRSSSFALGSPTPDPADAGRRLGVRYIVTGSVQRAGNVLRVTAQLVDARGDREIWSLKLDRPVNAVFALQDQIAEQVARELDVTLHGRSSEYAQYGTEAYLAYLRGRALIDSRTIPDVEASIRQFTRATELAPSFAAAIADLARAKLLLLQLRGTAPAQARAEWQEIDHAVERAITINPQAGEAYFVRGQYRDYVLHDMAAAEADYRAGLELAPNYGPGWRLYATYLYDADRIDEALAAVDRARLVDPLGPENHYLKGEIVRNALGGSEESVALYLQAIAVAPDFYPAYARLGQVRAAEGRLAQAIQYTERSVAIEPRVDWPRDRLIWFYVDMGDLPAARDVLRGYAPGSAEEGASEALICYRAGRLKRAERRIRAAMSDTAEQTNGLAVILTTDAVIKNAVRSRDAAAARRFILAIPGLEREGGSLAVAEGNYPEVIQLATLEHLAGNRRRGDRLAARILDFLDRGGTFGLAGANEWARASASALLGRNDMALRSLRQLLAASRIGWWDRIEGNPAFDALRTTPAFRSIERDDRIWLEGERRALGQMRLKGDVPLRSGAGPSPAGC